MQHFINFTNSSKDDPIIWILVGHYTLTTNTDVINLSRVNNVTIVCLPQKAYYSQEIKTWLPNNPGRTLTNKYCARLFGSAYEKAATMSNSVNGFRKIGLFPCSRTIFTENGVIIFND